MAAFTYTAPTVGGSSDTWGTTLNQNWADLSTFLGSLDSAELAVLDGITATTAELNVLDGVTATTAELNILDGVTATTAELNLLDGVTATTIELNYVDGVTSAIQTQLDAKAADTTQAEATWEAGTGTTESIVSPAKVKAAVLANPTGLGTSQSWQDMSSSRASDLTVYQNTTGSPIAANVLYSGDFNSAYFEVSSNNSDWVRVFEDQGDGGPVPMTGLVIPDQHYYRSKTTGGTNDPSWFELR